jgi:molybdate transport system substrate-binding protein
MPMMRTVCILAVILFCAATIAAQEITVAAASDLNFALKDIARKYESETGTKVKLTFGSSGNFSAAIQNGAPYDLFFSADVQYPKALVQGGWAEAGSIYEYALGRLALWAPANSPLNVNQGMSLLGEARVRKVAVANPKHAPYGRAAVEALRAASVYDRVQPKLVLGENISQTAQFVETGNADVGVLALSLAMSPTMRGKYWLVPVNLYSPLRQAAVVVSSSKQKEAAKKFLEFVKSSEAREILKKYGFERP